MNEAEEERIRTKEDGEDKAMQLVIHWRQPSLASATMRSSSRGWSAFSGCFKYPAIPALWQESTCLIGRG